jgi:hypothetical protein
LKFDFRGDVMAEFVQYRHEAIGRESTQLKISYPTEVRVADPGSPLSIAS